MQAAAVTAFAFRMFGIKTIAGQTFQDVEREIVIGRALWKKRWQMNPAAIGQAILLDGEAYTIARVADLPGDLLPGAELRLPLKPKAAESRSAHEIEAVGQLRDAVSAGLG